MAAITIPTVNVGAKKPRSAEMFPGPGFRIRAEFNRLDRSLMQKFAEFATPDISDLLNRLYAVDPGIVCLTGRQHQLCGPACTVKRSEEHTSELQSPVHLVCCLLLEKKKRTTLRAQL